MLSSKKRSTHRLSSLFMSSHNDSSDTTSNGSSAGSGRLTKLKNRVSSSSTHLPIDQNPPPVPKLPPQHAVPMPPPSSRSAPPVQAPANITTQEPDAVLQPPPSIVTMNSPRSRSSSPGRLNKSRPNTSQGISNGSSMLAPADASAKKSRRASRFFGGGKSSDDSLKEKNVPQAWVVGHKGKVPYDLAPLITGAPVPELWDEAGDTLVYLHPRTSNKGASFRIDSSVYASSRAMTRLIHGGLYSGPTLPVDDLADRSVRSSYAGTAPPSRTNSPIQSGAGSSDGSKGSRALSDAVEDDFSEKHLYMPIALSTDQEPVTPGGTQLPSSVEDIDVLISYRNFVAFLVGQSLVATPRHAEIFDIFLRISEILHQYNFSNVDSSTFGEVAASSFDSYVDELGLADVRHSRQKTIEAIVLGEKMRSMTLYTEGFVHAVGKYDEIQELRHPKFQLISPMTGTRLARSALDLANREQNIKNKLKDFEFPAIFAGLMNSAMADEGKMIRFKSWKSAFMSTRSFLLDYYKSKYGSWLPRARNKKNDLTTDGLNRLVLKEIYRDLTDLYDMLVDRTNLTNRTQDGFLNEDTRTDFESVGNRALRMVLSEYDRSTPPVQPPIPFDVPISPSLKSLGKAYPSGDYKKDQKARSKKLKKDEIAQALKQSYNPDADKPSPFLDAFRNFEKKQASGSTMEQLWELRCGQWLFLYAVIQSLPLMVVDAPGIRFAEGVEYFLCEIPRSGAPWSREDTSRARKWFGIDGGKQVVSLPADIVDNGVEGIFRRSHCWKIAEAWAKNDTMLTAAMQEMNADPLPPPPGFLDPSSADNRPRSSHSTDRKRESVMDLGLEALPLPPGFAPPGTPGSRPVSLHDPNKTFDSFLGSTLSEKDKKKKKK
ncbi:unnamed protein product [Periconia digitata]|uniref:DUF8004 domain-containing protein n=1 Tax=Periconia digitata TaxID=1303443 RepID=A0A9W4UK44_9PLEO|nr:unnamed protein product [Periconia digitata]